MTPGSGRACIEVLDQETVNQIAAGEVIERPASVVKEVIENAIDADARQIITEIGSDRRSVTRIRVRDDGTGMGREDAVMAFSAHATSKIRRIQDLDTVLTLGFRGEALASIAAVSRVSLTTRLRGVVSGTEVVIEGGEVASARDAGAPEGTVVVVEDLFYNTPARREFLKSLNIELAHIYTVVEREALAHPGISFRLIHNSRERFATPGTSSLMDALISLYGTGTADALIPVSGRTPLVSVDGYISRPALTRGQPGRMTICINNRAIYAKQITGAVRDGYGTLLPDNRYPVAFLHITTDTAAVDVNVHPAKREVRLSREGEILPEITGIIRDALSRHDLIPAGSHMQVGSAPVPSPLPGVSEPAHSLQASAGRQLRLTSQDAGEPSRERNHLPEMEVIGQFSCTYIIARSKTGDDLFLIDQHAAHERILYEQVKEMSRASCTSQELIVPVILRLTPTETAAMEGVLPVLREEGFVVEEFGSGTYAVKAVPVVLGKLQDPEMIRGIIEEFLDDHRERRVSPKEKITRIVACRGAIKAGTALTTEQMSQVIRQLSFTATPYTCPHGRPTVVVFPRTHLDRIFKRI